MNSTNTEKSPSETSQESEGLLACPFCGEAPRLEFDDNVLRWKIDCNNVSCFSHCDVQYDDKARTIKVWNTRTHRKQENLMTFEEYFEKYEKPKNYEYPLLMKHHQSRGWNAAVCYSEGFEAELLTLRARLEKAEAACVEKDGEIHYLRQNADMAPANSYATNGSKILATLAAAEEMEKALKYAAKHAKCHCDVHPSKGEPVECEHQIAVKAKSALTKFQNARGK